MSRDYSDARLLYWPVCVVHALAFLDVLRVLQSMQVRIVSVSGAYGGILPQDLARLLASRCLHKLIDYNQSEVIRIYDASCKDGIPEPIWQVTINISFFYPYRWFWYTSCIK